MSWLLLQKKLFILPAFGLVLMGALFSSCEQSVTGLGTKVDLTAPVVQINGDLGPSPGAYVSDNERFWINASDDSGIEGVTVTYTYSTADENGALIPQPPVTVSAWPDGETGQYYVDIDTTGMADGSLELQVNARDSTGKVTSSDKLVYTVKNKPPVIELQIPRPVVTDGALSGDPEDHQVVVNNFITGMFQDLAG
ncbi:MAG: hypothetical protein LBE14_00640, partial [Treponema sp.]|nr:hypothetical protein [Treponema sp.]